MTITAAEAMERAESAALRFGEPIAADPASLLTDGEFYVVSCGHPKYLAGDDAHFNPDLPHFWVSIKTGRVKPMRLVEHPEMYDDLRPVSP